MAKEIGFGEIRDDVATPKQVAVLVKFRWCKRSVARKMSRSLATKIIAYIKQGDES